MEGFGWANFFGLVLFLAIAYYGFYKKIYLPVAERRKKEKAEAQIEKESPGSKKQP